MPKAWQQVSDKSPACSLGWCSLLVTGPIQRVIAFPAAGGNLAREVGVLDQPLGGFENVQTKYFP